MHKVLVRMRAIVRACWREANAVLRELWVRLPIRDRSVLYESYAGVGALCNPEAIFRELLTAPDMADLQHTWVVDRYRRTSAFREEFSRNARVRFVRRGSPAYFRAIATRRYLVNNATFPPEFTKRPGQIYLNTWHGTPFKRMGYDIPMDGALTAANTMRNFLSADFLLSQNSFMTEQMYGTAYRLRGPFTGRIIEGEYPRMDRQILDQDQRQASRSRLEALGIPLAGRQLVVYAPTWRGADFSSPEDNAEQLVANTRRLEELLGPERYVVALKTHQALHDLASDHPDWTPLLIPNDIPTNVVLGVTDVLVTDYSSIFFDYLPLPGPIVFFSDDSVHYSNTRGTYFNTDELPGQFCTDLETVAENILGQSDDDGAAGSRRKEWRARFVGRADGHASERIADIVFRGRPAERGEAWFAAEQQTSILLHVGSLRSNGITSAGLNLLESIDPSEFDVSVVFARPRPDGQSAANQRLIPSHVRQFVRLPEAESRIGRTRLRLWFFLSQRPVLTPSSRKNGSWQRQWRSVFGSVSFDHIVDFDGYGPFWANLMLHGAAKTRSIWLHNDMAAEQDRLIDGRRRIKRSLGAVFALYPRFDFLVSVSPALRDLNRSSMARRLGLDTAAFRSARNVINGGRVLEAAKTGLAVAMSNDVHSPAPWLAELSSPARKTRWFVTVGRLSPEKNHARLVRAFQHVHSARPESRLMIIGGGPLFERLAELVSTLGLDDSVILTDYLSNPFPLVSAADCFVMSSNYEGQPMVILEAALLGLPIVSVNFTTVHDAFPESWVRVVDQDDEALAKGMLDGIEESPRHPGLDFVSYNVAAFAEFRHAIGAGRSGSPRSKTTVFVVDAGDAVRDVLLVSSSPNAPTMFEIVGHASTAAHVPDEIRALGPDVVLIGDNLADGNGVELARKLRHLDPELRAVVVVSRNDRDGTYGTIRVTPNGFSVVDIPTSRFAEALRNAALGRARLGHWDVRPREPWGTLPDFQDDN